MNKKELLQQITNNIVWAKQDEIQIVTAVNRILDLIKQEKIAYAAKLIIESKIQSSTHSLECNTKIKGNTICDCGTVAYNNGAQAQIAELRQKNTGDL